MVSAGGCKNKDNRVQPLANETNADISKECMTGSFSLNNGVYRNDGDENANGETQDFINRAKDALSLVGYNCEFDNCKIEYENDEFNFRETYKVSTNVNGKNISATFRKDNKNLIKIDSGDIVSDNASGAKTADEIINYAKKYYQTLPLTQGYVVSNYQTDFGGNDWQVDFSKKFDVSDYDKDVYNYAETVRMRISGTDGRLLYLVVFDTTVLTKETDKTQITREQAIETAGLEVSKLTDAYIGCYTVRDKGYARLCWCVEFDYSAHDGVCDKRTVYVDLYDNVQIGYESC